MRRVLVKNFLFVLLVNLLVKPVWIILIDRTVQVRVGHHDYGSYQALFNLGIIFQILLDFGLTNYNNREIARNPRSIRILFSSMFWTRLIFLAAYIVLVMGTGYMLGYRGGLLGLLAGVLAIQALNSMLLFIRSNISGLHYFRTDGILSVTDRFLMILVCGGLLFYPMTASHFKIHWYVISQAGCYLVAVIVAFIVLYRISPVDLHFSFHPRLIKRVIKQSLPYASLVFLMSVYMRSDMVLIERLCGNDKTQAGIYAAAFRFLDVANIFGLMFSGILLPLFGRMLANDQKVAPLVRTSVNMMMPVSFMVAVASVLFRDEVMHTFLPMATDYDGYIFALLMCTFPAYCLLYIYSTLLTANGNLALLNKITVVAVALNLALNFYLIPRYQALGAAITACVTMWTLGVSFIYSSHKKLYLPHNVKWLSAHVAYFFLLVITAIMLSVIPGIGKVYQLIMFLAVASGLTFVFRFVAPANIRSLLAKAEH